MSKLKVYPEILPDCLRELPKLLYGKYAIVAEMILQAGPGNEGAMACEMAADMLSGEMQLDRDWARSNEELLRLSENADKAADWAWQTGSAPFFEMPGLDLKFDLFINLRLAAQKPFSRERVVRLDRAAEKARALAALFRKMEVSDAA